MFQCDSQLEVTGGWMTDAYAMDMCAVVPREPAEVNIATASVTLSFGMNILAIKSSDVLERMVINMCMAATGGFCDECFR